MAVGAAPVASGLTCNSTQLISDSHIQSMVGLYECFNNNTLGKIWTNAMPYLFPFLVEYKSVRLFLGFDS